MGNNLSCGNICATYMYVSRNFGKRSCHNLFPTHNCCEYSLVTSTSFIRITLCTRCTKPTSDAGVNPLAYLKKCYRILEMKWALRWVVLFECSAHQLVFLVIPVVRYTQLVFMTVYPLINNWYTLRTQRYVICLRTLTWKQKLDSYSTMWNSD